MPKSDDMDADFCALAITLHLALQMACAGYLSVGKDPEMGKIAGQISTAVTARVASLRAWQDGRAGVEGQAPAAGAAQAEPPAEEEKGARAPVEAALDIAGAVDAFFRSDAGAETLDAFLRSPKGGDVLHRHIEATGLAMRHRGEPEGLEGDWLTRAFPKA
jgi:hypothetical protein